MRAFGGSQRKRQSDERKLRSCLLCVGERPEKARIVAAA
jgi:hypothetical protein